MNKILVITAITVFALLLTIPLNTFAQYPDPDNVYDKYLELEKLYLKSDPQKEVKQKKRTKRK